VFEPWYLSDLVEPAPDAPRLISTFSGGGGSSMGYKLAGINVVHACEIDAKMFNVYKRNISGTPVFEGSIADERFKEIVEAENPDILDGSPPCSTFSVAGNREESWGELRVFNEGQKKQVLSELFFAFLDLVPLAKPKIVIAENVPGILLGNAKGYAKAIVQELEDLGYATQTFILNGAFCGVPQIRRRVFFIGRLPDIQPLRVQVDDQPTTVKQALAGIKNDVKRKPFKKGGEIERWMRLTLPGEKLSDARERVRSSPWECGFNHVRVGWEGPARTITSHGSICHPLEVGHLTEKEFQRLGTFPEDYDFGKPVGDYIGTTTQQYIVGMSVPPRMAERVGMAAKFALDC